jgi:gas vesicle protein
MTDDRFSSGGAIFMTFLAGAVAGAAVALLTTPKRGSEMREQLRNWAGNSKVGEVVQRATTSARRAFDDTLSEVNPDH